MIFRVEKNKNYTVISNYHLRDKRLSLKAKGLLSWMLSNSEDWDYSIKGIVANCKENETAIKSTLQELKKYQYLEIKKYPSTDTTPTFHYEYIIHEQPVDTVENPGIENPGLGFPDMENQTLINKGPIDTYTLQSLEPTDLGIMDRSTEGKKDRRKRRVGKQEFETFKELYNEHCFNLPKIRQLSDKRMKAIQLIMNKYTVDEIIEVFDKANSSDFLTGNNDRGWTADIDFILREDKFLNILENKYGGKKRKQSFDGLEVTQKVTKEERENEYIYQFK